MFQIFSLNHSNFIDLIVLSIILFLGLVFRIANERERNCDSLRDYNDIEDVENCKEFTGGPDEEPWYNFQGTETKEDRPIGCYLVGKLNTRSEKSYIYFNYHNSGAGANKSYPICLQGT